MTKKQKDWYNIVPRQYMPALEGGIGIALLGLGVIAYKIYKHVKENWSQWEYEAIKAEHERLSNKLEEANAIVDNLSQKIVDYSQVLTMRHNEHVRPHFAELIKEAAIQLHNEHNEVKSLTGLLHPVEQRLHAIDHQPMTIEHQLVRNIVMDQMLNEDLYDVTNVTTHDFPTMEHTQIFMDF